MRVLLLEGQPGDREALTSLLSSWNYDVDTALDGEEAYRKLLANPADILLADVSLPRAGGLELLRRLQDQREAPVAIAVGSNSSERAAHEPGAFWHCRKPVEPSDLRLLLERASEQRRLARAPEMGPCEMPGLAGRTTEMQHIFSLVRRVAPSCASVLITGESGTGKELVARAIHQLSRRSEGPFIAINCAAFPEGLVESELFGHEKGSFTGAVERHIGCLELASGGTLLLDEIGELPTQTQAKLLRVLDDSRVRRIGGRSEIQLDVRVLAATNRNLEDVMQSGHFRQDLFYRLNVFHVYMPPLRERRDDLPVISEALLETLNRKHGRQVSFILPEVIECFRRYPWPGNVRELRNVLETAVILAGEGALRLDHLPERFAQAASGLLVAGEGPSPVRRAAVALPIGTTVEQAEKALIEFTLQHTHNNKSRAAKMLGISPKTLHTKLRTYRSAVHVASAG